MSNPCEHPFCSRSIASKCSNHCQLDLCSEHFIEHENLFFAQYEKSFHQLKKSLDDYQSNIVLKNDTGVGDQRSLDALLASTQNFIKKKRQLLNDVKADQALLYQYDIEQIKLYRAVLQEYQGKEIEIISSSSSLPSPMSPSSSSSSTMDDNSDDDEDYRQRSNPISRRRDVVNYYGPCPLTRFGLYGLNEKHQIELCSFEDHPSDHHLISHFYNDHHIKWTLATQLIAALMKKSDPQKTIIFPKDAEIIDKRFYVIRCPLIDLHISSCKKKFYKKCLEKHLSSYHHLSAQTIEKVLHLIEVNGHLSFEDFDADELK